VSGYAYLIVRREWRDVVDYPDGATSEHASGTGADVAAAWNASHTVAPAAPESAADALAAWESRLKEHMRATVWQIQDPGVRQERYDAERAAFVVVDPPPGEAERVVASASATVRERQFWHARLLTRPPREAVILASGDAPLPRLAVTDHLEALDAEGWRVLHVAEERSVDHDGDASRTRLDGLSFLLCTDQRRVA
jgi:hypothetical protein